ADDDDESTAAIISEIWKDSSAIFCAAYDECPKDVIKPAGELHDLMTDAIHRAGNDDVMEKMTVRFRRDGDGSTKGLGTNWGLDPTPDSTVDPRGLGYYIDMGRVGVWI